MKPPSNPEHLWGRRDWLTAAGWFAILSSLGAGLLAFVRLLFRRAPVEPPTVFRAGAVTDYQEGSVSDRFLESWRVFIVRENDALFAVHARCTHLGCTPRWYGRDSKFKCPCHGSGFHASGVNFEGPAPRPLDRARIWVDDRAALWVDTGPRYPHAEWSRPEATVQVREQQGRV